MQMENVRKNKLAILIFILPAALLFVGIIIIPIFLTLYYSFLDWDGMNLAESVFIGLGNYKELLFGSATIFPKSVLNAFLLAILSVFIQLPLSLFLALLLAKGVKGENIFVSIFFVPVIISTVVIGQLFSKIYFPGSGIMDWFLTTVGLDALRPKNGWLGDPSTALFSVFLPTLWQYVGYHMLLMYAGIKSVSPDIKEAAYIDGASEMQTSLHIIIPMIKPVIRISVIFAVTGSLKAFDLIRVLTPSGGPDHATEVPSTLMARMSFGSNRYGFGSAIAVSIIFLCFFFAILIKKCFKTEED